MGKNADGLKNFADLGAALRAKVEAEPPPKLLRVHLNAGKHPASGETQWQGYFHHAGRQLRVVCAPPLWTHLPQGGADWVVVAIRVVPGIVFARAVHSVIASNFAGPQTPAETAMVEQVFDCYLSRDRMVRISSIDPEFAGVEGQILWAEKRLHETGYTLHLSLRNLSGGFCEIMLCGVRMMSGSDTILRACYKHSVNFRDHDVDVQIDLSAGLKCGD